MQCTAKYAQEGETLTRAIAEFLKSGDDLADEPTAEERARLSAAFDALRSWPSPAASLEEALQAARLALDEFRMGQEADGLAKSLIEAALGFLDGNGASLRPLPARRWRRRPTLKLAA